MKLTETMLNNGKSIRGAWSNKQLRILGLRKGFNFNKGWKSQLIGSQITEQQYKDFLELKDKHLDKLGNNLFDQLKESKCNMQHMNSIKEEIKQAKTCKDCIHGKTKNCSGNIVCNSYFNMNTDF